MKLKTILCVTLAALFVSVSANAEVSKELKQKLFERYDRQNLNIVKEKFLVMPLGDLGSGNTGAYAMKYDHYYSASTKDTWINEYKKRNRLDPLTTENVQSPGFTDALLPGEMLTVSKFYVHEGAKDTTLVDFYLVALDGKRVVAMQNFYKGVPGFVYKGEFGFLFRFLFPRLGADVNAAYTEIVNAIDPYLVLTSAYEQKNRSDAESAQARKSIELQPGMSKEDVIKAMGEPEKSVTFGNRITLTYKEVTIMFEDSKVVDVKPN